MNETKKPFERYLLLYLPWALAAVFRDENVVSYFIAWLGSFFIFFVVYSGWIKPLPNDRPVAAQLMRPIFLVQIIFIGYMACTSIFYFLNQLGIDQPPEALIFFDIDDNKLAFTALAQRYYVLGHAAFTTGLIGAMKYPVEKKYKVDNNKLANVLMVMAVVFLPLSSLALYVPGLSQFSGQFNSLSFIAGTLALAFAIPLNKVFNTLFCLFLYAVNFYQALTSGFKEPVIISVLVLGIFLYPSYKKLVLFTFVPALLTLFILLPTYNAVFRSNAWGDSVNADDAYKVALDAAINGDEDIKDQTTSGFLINRLSEVGMFITFLQSTPDDIDFYGFELLEQSITSVIPRVFWPSKPITEAMVMERVYNAGVVYRGSNVSAKPAYIVDGYLSAGTVGVILAMFIYGAAAQLISQKAEQLFGGYVLGTALIFTGLFQIMWRGLSFEFLLNSVFWSYITMLLLHKVLLKRNILERV